MCGNAHWPVCTCHRPYNPSHSSGNVFLERIDLKHPYRQNCNQKAVCALSFAASSQSQFRDNVMFLKILVHSFILGHILLKISAMEAHKTWQVCAQRSILSLQPVQLYCTLRILTTNFLLSNEIKIDILSYICFSSGHEWIWELDYKKGWAPKNWCFWTVVLEKTLESPLDCKEIQPVHLKGDQSWMFIGRTDVEAETPKLWPPDAKSWLNWKDPDVGKDWGQEEKGTTEDEMVGWHHQFDGHGFGWTPGVGDGQGGLECCGSWGRKESDTTERLNWLS